VPDEDLYEQGCWPSVFNSDHKWTFTLKKAKSWSPKSVNVADLVKQVPGVELVSLELQDHGYDRSLSSHRPGRWGRKLGRIATKLMKRFPRWEQEIAKIFRAFGALVDQTDMKTTERLAQIQFILCKIGA
jgi:ABC-type Zn uptake system ZnuABC Zn-binding protein ZnuA